MLAKSQNRYKSQDIDILNLCDAYGFCPGKEGSVRTYEANLWRMVVLDALTIPGLFRISVTNENFQPIICIEFPVKVVPRD